MNYLNQLSLIANAGSLAELPEDTGAEVAFMGRSNAGKSSLFNTLAGEKLARTSKTPGRTQRLFVFETALGHRVVDLPGYGFAKVPMAIREKLATLIEDYLYGRRSLVGIVLIMDIRHPLREQDKAVLTIAKGRGLPVHLVLSKADKLKRGAMSQQLLSVKKIMVDEQVTIQTFSSLTKMGLDELEGQLNSWFER